MVKGTEAGWGTCSRTVPLGSTVWALSYWNNNIAVGSGSRDIIILDAITGSQTAVLSGHTGQVGCVTFSLDGKLLVSGSDDMTVKLWDMQTGGVIKTFHGHTCWVWSVSLSIDCTRIASGSGLADSTVRLWDIQTGECLCTIKQQYTVDHVSFSPMNPQHLISTSGGKIWWWDINGHQIPPEYNSSHISFSPDHTQFSLCNGKVVTVLNSDSRVIVAKFHVAEDAKYCCFSPDGRLVAAAANNTAYVWDITNPDTHVETFVGHTYPIRSLVFSSPSSLISGSRDESVKFWKIGFLLADQVKNNPGSTLITLPPIRSVSLQVRAGAAISNDKDGVVKIWDLSTGLCKETFQIPAAKDLFRSNGDIKLIDGRLVFAWYRNGRVHIWDAGKVKLIKTLNTSDCWGLRISGDESKVFFLHDGGIQAWSMWTWEPVGEVKLEIKGKPYLDCLYIDNSRLWIHGYSSVQMGWDFGVSSPSPVSFDPSTGRPHLDVIGGAAWAGAGPPWIKDTATGKDVFHLGGKYAKPNDVQWDGQYLVAGYESGEVLILDFHDMLP